jgi:hypothetical protein
MAVMVVIDTVVSRVMVLLLLLFIHADQGPFTGERA